MVSFNRLKNGRKFYLAQARPPFISGKNRIRKIREKSGFENPGIFDQIFVTVHRNGLIYEVKQRFFEFFINFDVFKIAISSTKNIPMLKFVKNYLNQEIWDHINQKSQNFSYTFQGLSPSVRRTSFRLSNCHSITFVNMESYVMLCVNI